MGKRNSKIRHQRSAGQIVPQDRLLAGRSESSVNRISIRATSEFSGPIPHPDLLIKYNEIIPNGADRIMTMTEKQSDHRMSMENTYMGNQYKQSRLGTVIFALITFGFIISGTTLILFDKQPAGLFTFGVAIVPLVYGNKKGTADHTKQLEKKKTEN